MDQVNPELRDLAKAFADWAASMPAGTFYIYGSRVRGDHRPDSDVDVYVLWSNSIERGDIEAWAKANHEDFAALRQSLPGRPKFLERNDPLGNKIVKAQIEYRDRNVVCVRMAPK
jgi:predicted nucleotidyltransferase